MYGLVLEGGGAKGAYQIGAWKALRELNIEIKGISGTSVGALNGALIAQEDFEAGYDIWYNMSPSRVINIEDHILEKLIKFDITPDNLQDIIKHLRILLGGKGLDVSPLKELIHQHMKEDVIRKSKKDFGIVTVSLSDRRPMELYIEDIPKGELANYLLASANLPIFRVERLNGKLYLDGGFYDNLPIKLLTTKGYKDIIVVRLYGLGRTRKIKEDGFNITYINPSEELGRTLDFTTERARKNLKLGYYDTIRVLKGLKGTKYCIESREDEDYFLHFLLNLGEKKIYKLGEILGVEKMPYRRMLFEAIIPILFELLGFDEDGGYEDLVLALYERAAEKYGIERFKIYRYDEFADNVKNSYRPSRDKISHKIPRLLKSSDLLLKTVKNEILDEVVDELFKRYN